MQLPPDDTLLPISSAVFETYGVMAAPSREDSASLDAAAGGADAVSMAPCVSEMTCWGLGASLIPSVLHSAARWTLLRKDLD